jgi:ABC-type bacteriocin/lantibiotic exporter with double-glycine peptidase domain
LRGFNEPLVGSRKKISRACSLIGDVSALELEDKTSPEKRETDVGLKALALIARFHGIATDPQQLAHAAGLSNTRLDEKQLVLSARSIGLKARAVSVTANRLKNYTAPCASLGG